jgi:uncharacterized membrane protein YeaQ/YmgE (transglycosylase-associated protein family)
MDQVMQLGSVGFWGTILIGVIAGWVAEKLTGSNHGLIKNLFFGLVGSWLGFYAANIAGIRLGEFFLVLGQTSGLRGWRDCVAVCCQTDFRAQRPLTTALISNLLPIKQPHPERGGWLT